MDKIMGRGNKKGTWENEKEAESFFDFSHGQLFSTRAWIYITLDYYFENR